MATLFTDAFGSLNTTNWSVEFGTCGITLGKLNFNGSGAAFNWLQTKVAAHAALLDGSATVGPSQGGYDGGPMLRVSGSTTSPTCYYLDVIEGSTTCSIYRRVAGSDTLVSNVTLGVAATTANVFKFEATGSGGTVTFKVYQDGVQQDSNKTDTNGARIVAAGRTGLCSWNATTRFDNYAVDDATASVSADLTGTALAAFTETDVVTGSDTIVITLTGDTWIPN